MKGDVFWKQISVQKWPTHILVFVRGAFPVFSPHNLVNFLPKSSSETRILQVVASKPWWCSVVKYSWGDAGADDCARSLQWSIMCQFSFSNASISVKSIVWFSVQSVKNLGGLSRLSSPGSAASIFRRRLRLFSQLSLLFLSPTGASCLIQKSNIPRQIRLNQPIFFSSVRFNSGKIRVDTYSHKKDRFTYSIFFCKLSGNSDCPYSDKAGPACIPFRFSTTAHHVTWLHCRSGPNPSFLTRDES